MDSIEESFRFFLEIPPELLAENFSRDFFFKFKISPQISPNVPSETQKISLLQQRKL